MSTFNSSRRDLTRLTSTALNVSYWRINSFFSALVGARVYNCAAFLGGRGMGGRVDGLVFRTCFFGKC